MFGKKPQQTSVIQRALTPARDLIRGQTRRSSSYARELEEKSYAKLGQLAKEKGNLTNKASIFDEAASNLDQQTAEHFAKTINNQGGTGRRGNQL